MLSKASSVRAAVERGCAPRARQPILSKSPDVNLFGVAMIRRTTIVLALCLFPVSAWAQAPMKEQVTNPCGTLSPPYAPGVASPPVQDINGNGCAILSTQYPAGATPVTASATGTTAATTATLPAVAANYNFICGFAIRANATAAATANSTVTGTISGTLNFTQWTAPLASGVGITEERFSPCIPASAVNTGIAVVSAAPGSGGVVSVSAWGYYKTTSP